MCPWRVQPTTDTVEILSVKVFLIINAGPLHTGSTPGCLWTATTFHSLTAMNYSHRTCSHTCLWTNTCKDAPALDIWRRVHSPTKIMRPLCAQNGFEWRSASAETQATSFAVFIVYRAKMYRKPTCRNKTALLDPYVSYPTHTHIQALQPIGCESQSAHRPFAMFPMFSVFCPAVSRLSLCSLAQQTAPSSSK